MLRCQIQMVWSSEPLMTHFPFWSVTLKHAKMQCFVFVCPADMGRSMSALHQADHAAGYAAAHCESQELP